MHCAYCGNAFHTEDPRCESCGSSKPARRKPRYRDADDLYAEVGHAMVTGDPHRSRALLEKIIGSQETEPKRLWTERGAKIAFLLFLLYMFPVAIGVIAAFIIPFIIMVYLPFKGVSALFTWIANDTRR